MAEEPSSDAMLSPLATPAPFEALPAELISQIIGCLDKTALRSLAMVSQRLNICTRQHIFHCLNLGGLPSSDLHTLHYDLFNIRGVRHGPLRGAHLNAIRLRLWEEDTANEDFAASSEALCKLLSAVHSVGSVNLEIMLSSDDLGAFESRFLPSVTHLLSAECSKAAELRLWVDGADEGEAPPNHARFTAMKLGRLSQILSQLPMSALELNGIVMERLPESLAMKLSSPDLRRLSLIDCADVFTEASVGANLEEVTISTCGRVDGIPLVDFRTARALLDNSASSLKSLTLQNVEHQGVDIRPTSYPVVLSCLKRLNAADLWQDSVSMLETFFLCYSAPSLADLRLSVNSLVICAKDVVEALPHMPKLKTLSLHESRFNSQSETEDDRTWYKNLLRACKTRGIAMQTSCVSLRCDTPELLRDETARIRLIAADLTRLAISAHPTAAQTASTFAPVQLPRLTHLSITINDEVPDSSRRRWLDPNSQHYRALLDIFVGPQCSSLSLCVKIVGTNIFLRDLTHHIEGRASPLLRLVKGAVIIGGNVDRIAIVDLARKLCKLCDSLGIDLSQLKLVTTGTGGSRFTIPIGMAQLWLQQDSCR